MKIYNDFGKGLSIEYGMAPVSQRHDVTIFHMHPHYELLLVWEPAVNTTIVNGKTVEIDHPMAIITAPYAMHHTYFREAKTDAVERCVLYFDENFLESLGPRKIPVPELLGGANATILNISPCADRIRDLVRMMLSLGNGTRRYDRAAEANENQALMAAVLFGVLRDFSAQKNEGMRISEQNYVTEVMAYITRNLGENLTIPKIAEHFFISRDKLCRDFRRHVQINIGEFISTARLNQAREYLRENRLTVKEISAKCGFENDVYFYAFFKKHEGCTPKEYVKQKQAGIAPK